MVPADPERENCAEKALGHSCDCRPCRFGEHCGKHSEGCHRACRGAGPPRRHGMFLAYRPREHDRPNLGPVPKGRPRFEGVVFMDGTCVIRWGPPIRSSSQFSSFTAMMKAHGHPEFGTVIIWLGDQQDAADTA